MTVRKITVLIVEDHESTRKGLAFELASTDDIEVVGTAGTQEEGFVKMQSLEPDVVLLDLHLPDSIGPKSLSYAFTQAALSKVIVFSGDNRTAIRDLILKSGVHGYLLKSEPLEIVVKSIRSVMTASEQIISADLLKSNDGNLTRAEEHLLTLIARGMKYKDIGKERFTAPETVRKQVEQIVEKLSLESREALIAWAVENGYGNLETER